MKKKIAGYCRVSTKRQAEEGESLAVQEKRLRDWAKREGRTLTLYVEPGISAKDDRRPVYQQMRRDLETGKVDGVVITKLDRGWRSLKLAVNEIHLFCREWDRALVAVDQNFDTTSASGRVMLNILLTFAEFERDMTAERVKETREHKASQGLFCGGRLWYGYRSNGDGKLTVDKPEAERVREIFQLFLKHQLLHPLLTELNERGWRTQQNSRWTSGKLKRLLINPVYVGTLIDNANKNKRKQQRGAKPIVVTNAVPAIVKQETYDAVQGIFAENKTRFPTRSQQSNYLLSGLVHCAKCGGRMPGHSDGVRRYYRCRTYHQHGKGVCAAASISAGNLEAAIVEQLFEIRLDPKRLKEYLATDNESQRKHIPKVRQEIGRLKDRKTKLENRREQIKDAYEDGEYNLATMKERSRKAEKETQETDAALEAAQDKLGALEQQTVDVKAVVKQFLCGPNFLNSRN